MFSKCQETSERYHNILPKLSLGLNSLDDRVKMANIQNQLGIRRAITTDALLFKKWKSTSMADSQSTKKRKIQNYPK
jgi:hypothetical protein